MLFYFIKLGERYEVKSGVSLSFLLKTKSNLNRLTSLICLLINRSIHYIYTDVNKTIGYLPV